MSEQTTHQPDPFRPRLRKPGFLQEIISTLLFIVAVTVLFDLAIPRSLVEGRSMQPNFQDGERLIISRVNYLFGKPERGDVLVFNSLNERESEAGVMLIKRVVGLPGETIEFREQKLYINGKLFNESYIKDECIPSRCKDNTWELGDDEYFVMGDNRNNSRDSRSFNQVPLDHIVGEVLFRYWPPTSWGFITHPLDSPNP